MIQVNIKVTGMVKIHRYNDDRELRSFRKEDIQNKLESLEFESKEIQKELSEFNRILLMVKTIGLGSRKVRRVDVYLDGMSFGRKKPEITIMGNYPLYNMLKKFIE